MSTGSPTCADALFSSDFFRIKLGKGIEILHRIICGLIPAVCNARFLATESMNINRNVSIKARSYKSHPYHPVRYIDIVW